MPSQNPRRVRELDALRGMAAVSVVFFHYILVLKGADVAAYRSAHSTFSLLGKTPLGILWAGHAAVVLFFVLSGFVLYLMLDSTRLGYVAYTTRRVLRLYLPYMAAIALGVAGERFLYVGGLDGLAHWINKFWSWPISAQALGQHMWVLGQFNSDRYDFTIWSLVHEMRISLLFPALFGLVRRRAWWLVLTGAFALSVAMAALRLAVFREWTDWGQVLTGGGLTAYSYTVHYILAFVVGALLARHRRMLQAWYRRHSRRARAGWMLTAGFLYLYGDRMPDWLGFHMMIAGDWPITIGAALVLLVATSSDAIAAMLHRRVFQYLGRISYSLYLMHPIVLLATLHVSYGRIPLSVLLLAAFALTFPFADLANRTIERPAATLGRKAAAGMSPRRAQRSRLRPIYYYRTDRRRTSTETVLYQSGKAD